MPSGSGSIEYASVSPWAAPGVYLVSVDFLKRGDITAALASHAWDLLVVDEVHTATSPNDRHAAQKLTSRPERKWDPAGRLVLDKLSR